MPEPRMPVFYITHGGGPSFWIDYPEPIGKHGFDNLKHFLAGMPESLPQPPRAYLVVTAHWETDVVTVSGGVKPGMLYDYYNFPPIAYELQHPAPGDPQLAAKVRQLLDAAEIPNAQDDERGFDHGVFVPMMIVDPEAAIPTVMLSLRRDLDPAFHVALGRALAPLRDEGVVIIGSGSSYHNLQHYFRSEHPAATPFDNWLTRVSTAPPQERDAGLIAWTDAPGAREVHPREEHLLPLHVAAGAAQDDVGVQIFNDDIANKPFSCYGFGQMI